MVTEYLGSAQSGPKSFGGIFVAFSVFFCSSHRVPFFRSVGIHVGTSCCWCPLCPPVSRSRPDLGASAGYVANYVESSMPFLLKRGVIGTEDGIFFREFVNSFAEMACSSAGRQ